MSFCTDVKNELIRNKSNKPCCKVAELYGIMIFAGTFGIKKIRLQTHNPNIVKYITNLLSKIIDTDIVWESAKDGFILNFEGEAVKKAFTLFGYAYTESTLHLNRAVIDDDCCRTAFLRGAFIAAGTITDPEKKYHWEISSHHTTLMRELMALMLDIGYSPKMSKRKNDTLIYIKDSGIIEDILTYMGAPQAAMKIMQIKVEKELRNDVNRKMNCDGANIAKTVNAAFRQVQAVKILKEKGLFESLPESLKETAEIRLNNPELTLNEMLPLFRTPISKPGLSHRLNRLVNLAEGENNNE